MGSAQMMRPLKDKPKRLSLAEIKKFAENFDKKFLAMTEKQQERYLLIQRLNLILGMASKHYTREDIARATMTRERGPKFAARMLANKRFRKDLKLDS